MVGQTIETSFPDNSWEARGDTREHYPEGLRGGTDLFDFAKNVFRQKLGSPDKLQR